MRVVRDGYVGIAPVPGGRVNVGIVLGRSWRTELVRRWGARRSPTRSCAAIPPTAAMTRRRGAAGRRCDAVAGAWPLGHRVTRRAGRGWLAGRRCGRVPRPVHRRGPAPALVSAELAAAAIRAAPRRTAAGLRGAYERAMRRRFLAKDARVLAGPGVPGPAARCSSTPRGGWPPGPAVRATMGLVMGDLVPAPARARPALPRRAAGAVTHDRQLDRGIDIDAPPGARLRARPRRDALGAAPPPLRPVASGRAPARRCASSSTSSRGGRSSRARARPAGGLAGADVVRARRPGGCGSSTSPARRRGMDVTWRIEPDRATRLPRVAIEHDFAPRLPRVRARSSIAAFTRPIAGGRWPRSRRSPRRSTRRVRTPPRLGRTIAHERPTTRLDHRHRHHHRGRDGRRRVPGRAAGRPVAGRGGSTGSIRSPFRSQVAAQVDDFDPLAWMPPKTARQLDRFSQFGLVAGRLALEDAALTPGRRRRRRTRSASGSTSARRWAASPTPRSSTSATSSAASARSPRTSRSRSSAARRRPTSGIALDVRGPILSTANSCASGAVALGEALGRPPRGPDRRRDRRWLRDPAEPARVRGVRHHPGAVGRPQRRPGARGPAVRRRARRLRHGRGRGAARARGRPRSAERARRDPVRGAARLRRDVGRPPHGPAAGRRPGGRPGGDDRPRRRRASTRARSTTSTPTPRRRRSATWPRRGRSRSRSASAPRPSRSAARRRCYGHPLGASGAIEAAICALAIRDGWAPASVNLVDPDPEIADAPARPAARGPRRRLPARAVDLVRVRRAQRGARLRGARRR